MSEFGKYGVGGKIPGKPLNAPDETTVSLDEVGTGTRNFTPDVDAHGINHKGSQGSGNES